MSISKKIRFEVFKRDSFSCVYCGKTPPTVILEVDHIDPKSKGGANDINNLITACFDCNRGKRNIPLDKIPPRLSDNLDVLKEQEEQIKEYRNFVKKIDRRINSSVAKVTAIYEAAFPKTTFSDNFKLQVKRFMKMLPEHEVMEAIEIATVRGLDKERSIKYFCGVCWRKIKGDGLYE